MTRSGAYSCYQGRTCTIEIQDVFFNEIFLARPEAGYSFAGWKRQADGLCGGFRKECHLFTVGFDSYPELMELIASDKTYFLTPVFQTSPPTDQYDVNFWRKLLDEIDSGIFTTNDFLYEYLPDVGNCDPGVLTNTARSRAKRTLNEIRKLHRLPPVAYDHLYDPHVQSAALIQHANNYINHFPQPGDECFSELGAYGSRASNIGGRSRIANEDPAEDVLSWSHDRNNISTLMAAGHRRWVLYPELGYISYGQVFGESVQKTFDFGREPGEVPSDDLQFVAFPYQTYPYVLAEIGEKPTPWSISLVRAGDQEFQFEYFRDATVSVSEWDNGFELEVHSIYTDTRRFGIPNFLSWLVEDYDYDTTYRVVISNIVFPDGSRSSIEYYVHLDYFNLVDLSEPLEVGDRQDGKTLKGSFTSKNDKDSYKINLAGVTRFDGESRFTNQAFYILVYDANKRLIASYDEAFQQELESGEYTVVVSPCNENGRCYTGDTAYEVSITSL